MRENQGNILRVIHETDCDLKIAKEALNKCDNWVDTIKYAKDNK